METIKEVKRETKKISELNFEKVDLDVENGKDDFYFLAEFLRDVLLEELEQKKIKPISEITPLYSLSYCQGDGFMFEGKFETEKGRFKITHSGRYYHEYAKDIELICKFEGEDEIYDISIEEESELIDEFDELYKEICREMKRIGYEEIERQEEDNIAQAGFSEWVEKNNIKTSLDLLDIDYKIIDLWLNKNTDNKDLKGYIKICNSGNTNMELWIKDYDIVIKDMLKAKAEVIEYSEKIFR